MHPLMLQQLATARRNEMVANAGDWRQARQMRRARPSGTSRPRTRPGLPRTQAEPRRASADTAIAVRPPIGSAAEDAERVGNMTQMVRLLVDSAER